MNNTTARLLLSKRTATGQRTRLGALNFDESNRATLSLEYTGPEAEELQKVWKELSARRELTWKRSEPGELDGAPIVRVIGETVKPGEFAYIYAVMNTLERKYGYWVELERP